MCPNGPRDRLSANVPSIEQTTFDLLALRILADPLKKECRYRSATQSWPQVLLRFFSERPRDVHSLAWYSSTRCQRANARLNRESVLRAFERSSLVMSNVLGRHPLRPKNQNLLDNNGRPIATKFLLHRQQSRQTCSFIPHE